MPFSVPRDVATRSQQQGLGAARAVYRRRRRVRPGVLWAVTAAVMTAAILTGAVAHQHLVGVLLVFLFLLGLAGYRYRYGVARQLVVLYDRGFAHAEGAAVRVAPWDEIPHVWRRPGTVILGLEPALTLTGFARQEEMAAAIDALLQPRALVRAQAQLSVAGRAEFPPLAVTPDGPRVSRGAYEDSATWSQLDSYERVDSGRLVISLAGAAGSPPWFDEVVPDAVAAEALMDQTDPTTAPASAAQLVAADLRAAAVGARQRTARTRAWALFQGIMMAVLALTVATIAGVSSTGANTDVSAISPVSKPGVPSDSDGYQSVCTGGKFPGAASYSGPAPHPVIFEGDSGFTAANTDNGDVGGELVNEPNEWEPSNLAQVQLVACITTAQASTFANTCSYESGVTETLYYQTFTVTLYAAQTGKRITGPTTVQGDDTSCPEQIFFSAEPAQNLASAAPSGLYSSLTIGQLQQTIGKYIQ